MKPVSFVLLALAIQATALPSVPMGQENQDNPLEPRDTKTPKYRWTYRGDAILSHRTSTLVQRAVLATTGSTTSFSRTTTHSSSSSTMTTRASSTASTTTKAGLSSNGSTTTKPPSATGSTTRRTTTTSKISGSSSTVDAITQTTTSHTTVKTTTTARVSSSTTTLHTSTTTTTRTTTTTKAAAAATRTLDVSGMTYQSAMLTVHNLHRANHSLPNLIWDTDLAKIAQDIANSCTYAHNVTADGGGYGQNIGAGAPGTSAAGLITNLMYNSEINYYPQPYGVDDVDLSNFHNWGHYSQLVWSDTTNVGCVTQYCPNGLANTGSGVAPYFTVCNYSPPGNYVGEFSAVAAPGGGQTVVVVGGS